MTNLFWSFFFIIIQKMKKVWYNVYDRRKMSNRGINDREIISNETRV